MLHNADSAGNPSGAPSSVASTPSFFTQPMPLTVAIVQSNYIPWKGYFDLMRSADVFVLYDSVQYTKRDWRNRNRIKTPQGVQWLSIPAQVKSRYLQRIRDVEIAEPHWHERHWASLHTNYRAAAHYDAMAPQIADLYDRCAGMTHLSKVNALLLRGLADMLGVRTPFVDSGSLGSRPGRTDNLVHLCRELGATTYLSGPAAQDYMDERLFEEVGIAVRYFDYAGYKTYPQLHGPFDHHVSAVDLLMNTGHQAAQYLERAAPAAP